LVIASKSLNETGYSVGRFSNLIEIAPLYTNNGEIVENSYPF